MYDISEFIMALYFIDIFRLCEADWEDGKFFYSLEREMLRTVEATKWNIPILTEILHYTWKAVSLI